MNSKAKNAYLTSAIFAVLSALFIVLIKTVDVQAIGPEGTNVGFAGINGFFHELIGTHKLFYYISEVGGIVAILIAVLFAVLGFLQLVQRKNLLKVDKNILAMGAVYIIVILLYIIFEKVPVNYRPVITDEGLEASFPSTHTMLACCIIGCAMIECREVVTNRKTQLLINRVLLGVMVVTILCRFISGVHWFTDIIGGILISCAVIMLYLGFVLQNRPAKKKRIRTK